MTLLVYTKYKDKLSKNVNLIYLVMINTGGPFHIRQIFVHLTGLCVYVNFKKKYN